MTTSNEHNNAPSVPQGEPVAWMVHGNYTRQPFGMLSSAEAYMRGLLKSDPDGGYHIRPLRYTTPAPAPAQEIDKSVADAEIKAMYVESQGSDKGWLGIEGSYFIGGVVAARKQKAALAPAQDEPLGHFRAEPFGWTDCAKDDEGAIALYERPQEVGLTDEEPDPTLSAMMGMPTSRKVWAEFKAWQADKEAALRAKGGKL